jgi:surface antigen
MVQRCAWVGVLVLSGCAGMPGMPTEPPAEKMQLMQSVLNRTPDGSVGYWRHNDDNFGLVAVDSTVRKGDSTCRLVREDQVVGGRSGQLVSSYCRVGRGAWQ